MDSYPISCPHCGQTFDSMDSYGDTRADVDAHLLRAHPDLPDPTIDRRFGWLEDDK
jgi:hypothetical protein